MKFFTIILFMFVFSGFAFAQSAGDIAGDWAWSGNGCRDSSLSAGSHVSAGRGNVEVSSAVLTLNADGTASMLMFVTIPEEGGGPRRLQESGTWKLDGSRILIADPSIDDENAFPLEWVDGELVGVDEDSTAQGRDEGSTEPRWCEGDKVFVRIFSKVSE